PSKTVADAKIAIHEMAEYTQKWHNRPFSRTRSTETFDGLFAIQAQLNNLRRDIKKVNEKVYAPQDLQEREFGSLPSSMETNPRDQAKSISTDKADFSEIRCIGCGPYAREAQDVKILDAYDHTLPQKEKDPGSFTLPCFTIIDDDDVTKGVVLGMPFCKKYLSCQMIMKKFAHGDECERIMEE
ncbi:hypothetical protein Tco_0356888, partial [Tanacetum coccineum]